VATNNDNMFIFHLVSYLMTFTCGYFHSLFVCPFKGAIMLFFSQSLNWSFCSIELAP
jgi:hypothetical protein